MYFRKQLNRYFLLLHVVWIYTRRGCFSLSHLVFNVFRSAFWHTYFNTLWFLTKLQICLFLSCPLAPACHELSYPQPLQGTRTCSQIVGGWQCIVTCNDGFLIRGIGKTTTVTCGTVGAWSDGDIVTSCIRGKSYTGFSVSTLNKVLLDVCNANI